jgi:hypothetical protein
VLLLSNRNDELILLTERIQNELRGRVREFRLDADQRGLTLFGIARSYHEKQLAQHAVMRNASLPIAANEITVE